MRVTVLPCPSSPLFFPLPVLFHTWHFPLSPSFPCCSVLVGNKCDLEDQRKVRRQEGEELAAKWGVEFREASAKTKVNNEECFFELVRQVRLKQARVSAAGKKPKKRRCTIL